MQDILKEAEMMSQMPVTEWLDRMNLLKYMPMFTKHRVFTVKEINYYVNEQGKFNDSFDFKNTHD